MVRGDLRSSPAAGSGVDEVDGGLTQGRFGRDFAVENVNLGASQRGQPVAPGEHIAAPEGDKHQRAPLFEPLQVEDRRIVLPQQDGEAFQEASVIGPLDDDQ